MASRDRRRLVLYSGGQEPRNRLIHESLLALALRRRAGDARGEIRMTYVPFTHEGAGAFFKRFERRYAPFGATRFECLPPDLPGLERPGKLRRATLAALRASDVVYLSGGNTFHFLHHLRRSGMLEALRRFALRGGVVAGLSAGGILMTPDIGLAGYPPFDRDEDEIGLSKRDRRALGLVGFDFFPHYRRSSRLREALLRYSRRSTRPLYACRDGSGIVVEQDRFTAHGEVWLFDRGRVRRLGDPG
ncbi:MAG TPA: Type 1 glutamine amidotransferase-like domain-containing protein [Myxococcota bacterium]|nr:Type 1 glutamine amidotransferase-like domain-containing protein [Myxococcota bacterium]